MGNNVTRAGIEPTSLAFRASVLSLHHIGSLMSALYPCPPVYVALCFRGQYTLLRLPPRIESLLMLTITYMQAMALHITNIYTYTGQVQQPYSTYLVQDHGHGNQCCGCDKNGKYHAQIRTRTHIPDIPGQCTTITPHKLPDVTTIPMPTCLCGSLLQRSVQTTTMPIQYAYILCIYLETQST